MDNMCKCGGVHFFMETKGSQTGLYCSDCGKWQKWLTKDADMMELFDMDRPFLKTTGCDRTGCMFCGYGCHLEEESRFKRMKETHPKQYDYIMRPKEQGGLNYKEVIDWINEHGGFHIEY